MRGFMQRWAGHPRKLDNPKPFPADDADGHGYGGSSEGYVGLPRLADDLHDAAKARISEKGHQLRRLHDSVIRVYPCDPRRISPLHP